LKIKLSKEATGIVIPKIDIFGPAGTVQVNMILDTGAAYTMLDLRTARKVGYRPTKSGKKIRIVTANGEISVPLIHIRRITMEGASASHVPVIVHDIPGVVEVAGLLGLSFLKYFRIVIDYKTLTLHID
jgi:clan AA aspartic protease (TIGR02281 family)